MRIASSSEISVAPTALQYTLNETLFNICVRICEKGSYARIRFCNFEEA